MFNEEVEVLRAVVHAGGLQPRAQQQIHLQGATCHGS
jgi:hypothetical protein